MKKKIFKKKKGVDYGIYRSGLELKVGNELNDLGVKYDYEPPGWIRYQKPLSRYKPDFVLPNGIIVETKGYFVSKDRSKHKQIKEYNPELDIRFVFSNSRRFIGTTSKTTYGMWCERFGYKYADGSIPLEWLEESVPKQTLEKTRALLKCKQGKKQQK